jgi:diguanylate cyclase (GGDEF)-like protein/PAS domain S-box-containing protein
MPSRNKPRILAIDDTPVSLAVLTAALASEYEVTSLASCAEALPLLADESFDLILLDVVMPDMDGFAAFEAIRRCPKAENTPIIFITAADDHVSEHRGLALGASDFIFKPIRVDLVRLRIRNTLRLARIAGELANSEERLRYVMEATGDGVWDWNIATGEVVHNRAWCRLTGLDDAHLEHQLEFFADLIHPEDFAAVQTALYYCLEGHGPYRSQHRLRHADGHYFWVEDMGQIVQRSRGGKPLRMVGSIKDISLRKESEEKIHRLAFFDPLTELPNRRLFLDRIGQAVLRVQRNQLVGALMFIDMDRFKELNDTHGHAAGDALLIQVGSRLKNGVRRQDTVARLGGDEFVVLLESLPDDPDASLKLAKRIGNKLLKALNQPYDLGSITYHSTPSIGLTLFDRHTQNIDEVLARADRAMYAVKSAGRNALRCELATTAADSLSA